MQRDQLFLSEECSSRQKLRPGSKMEIIDGGLTVLSVGSAKLDLQISIQTLCTFSAHRNVIRHQQFRCQCRKEKEHRSWEANFSQDLMLLCAERTQNIAQLRFDSISVSIARPVQCGHSHIQYCGRANAA
jgi:hypothetical protein